MAEAWGGNVRNWRGGVAAWVQSETSTTATIRVVARWQSLAWGFNVPNGNTACVSCDGQSSGWVGVGGVYAGSGQTITKDMLVRDFTVAKHYGSGRNVGCYGGFHLGGYQVGDSGANCDVWIGGIPYSAPKPPVGFTAERESDDVAVLEWSGDYTGMDGAYPWSNVLIERRIDAGGWGQIKELNWDATSFRDSISAGHRYDYRVRSKGPGGHSGYVECPAYVYTTPTAPSGCTAVRKSDSRADVSWRIAANAAESYKNVLLERRTNNGGWVQIATLGATSVNYADTGISGNSRYDYRVRATNGLYSGYSTQNGYVYTTPAAPKSVSLAKIGGTRVRISIEAASPWADSYLYQLSLNGGGWSAEKSMGTSIEVDAGGGSVRARVRAKKGDLYSGYRESGTVTTVVPPNAPTLSEFANVYALPATVRVSWAKAHPDGSAQTAAQVEVTDPNGHTSVVEVTTESHADVSATVEGDHLVRVRTKGLDPSWGAWSPQGTFHAENAPTAHFVTPSSDGEVIDLIPFVATWDIVTSSGVSSQEIRLLTEAGDVLHSAQLPVDARSYSFSVDTYLPQNERKYIVQLTALDGYSLVAQAKRLISTNYAEPAEPKVSVTNVLGDLSARIVVYKGEGDSPESLLTVVPTVRLSVARMLDDGSQEMLIDDLASGNEVIDRLPPLNVDYTYLVTAYSAAGTATTAEVVAHIDSDGSEAFNFGVDAGRAILLGLDADASSGTSHSGEWFEFINGVGTSSLPAFYPDGGMSASGSHSYIVTTADKYRELDAMRRDRSNAVCWFRDHWGGRHRVKADWTLGYSAKSYGTWNVSASLTEAMWEGPRNG